MSSGLRRRRRPGDGGGGSSKAAAMPQIGGVISSPFNNDIYIYILISVVLSLYRPIYIYIYMLWQILTLLVWCVCKRSIPPQQNASQTVAVAAAVVVAATASIASFVSYDGRKRRGGSLPTE